MDVKKTISHIGNFLTVIALILLIQRLLSMDINYSLLLGQKQFFWTVILVVVYSINVAVFFIPWRMVLQLTTGEKTPMVLAQNVICKANLLKYIPGNIFQYVGRNEIAVLCNLKHSNVALATVLDIIANVLGALAVSVFCYTAGFQAGVQNIRAYIHPTFLLVTVAIFCAFLIFIYKWKLALIQRLMSYCTRTNISKYARCILYYIVSSIYTGLIYCLILICILDVVMTSELVFIVIGAYQLSWLLGFIMPGAPGGIGIREAVIVALLSAYISSDSVLLGIVLYRLINIVGDFLAFAVSSIICLCLRNSINCKKSTYEQESKKSM